MAEAVVDHLEVVEVDEQHCDGSELGTVEATAQLLQEVGAVGQTGELVVARRPLQVLRGAALFRDVLDVRDRELAAAAVAHHAHRGVRPHDLSVGAQVALLHAVARRAARSGRRQRPRHHLGDRLWIWCSVIGMGDVHHGAADQLLARGAQHPAQGPVDVQQGEFSGRRHCHTRRCGLERDLEPCLGLLQVPGLGEAGADVAQGDHDLLGVGDRCAQIGLHGVRTAVGMAQLEHRVGHLASLQDLLPDREHAASILRLDEVEEGTPEQIVGLTAGHRQGELVDLVEVAV